MVLHLLIKKLNIKNESAQSNHLLSFTRIIGVGRVLLSHYCADYCFASLTAKYRGRCAISHLIRHAVNDDSEKCHYSYYWVYGHGEWPLFAALMSTQGMPMVVELGVAFDLLCGCGFIWRFLFHIRSSIESLDVDSLNSLREDME